MILAAIALLGLGVFLSAFFSGSETGFYRASRVRILIDALDGDRISKFLLWLINNPTLFVATTLVGNNVANYMVSLAIVLFTQAIYTGDNSAVELIGPILMSPFLFVYGELMPKQLFYRAPNRLLRFGAPTFLSFTALFAPISAILWGLARVLERVLGQSPDQIRLALAKRELQQFLEEGLAAGILHPTQRHLAQNFFIVASQSVREVGTPLARVEAVDADISRNECLKFARRKKLPDIPVWNTDRTNLAGYVRTLDLFLELGDEASELPLRSLTSVKSTELYGETLLQMHARRETLVKIVDAGDPSIPIGIVTIDQLTNPLMDGPLGSLRR